MTEQVKDQNLKQSQVSEQQEYLEQELEILHKSIEVLATRLEPVLRGRDPQADNEEVEKPVLVVLAKAFRRAYESTKNARFNIDDLNERLEL